jgi:hypothetical protein
MHSDLLTKKKGMLGEFSAISQVVFVDHEMLLLTRWFKYDRDYLCVKKSQFVLVIFEPPCKLQFIVFMEEVHIGSDPIKQIEIKKSELNNRMMHRMFLR